MTDEMTSALAASGPRPEHKEALALYGRLAGTWDVRNRYFDESNGTWVNGTVVWTFGWILAGQAVQDVMWFTREDGIRSTGSTVRLYDPAADVWHVVWFSPFGTTCTLTGRPGANGDIVQEGVRLDGRPIRWLFTEVTDDSFRWLGYVSDDAGETWRFEQEMLAARQTDRSQ
ncbi:MAG TPA: hypothetical protein VGQ92_24190 [Actinoplanes sp.]|jgi:hypothetical protein|nr:hypothetical protein [Actinoplanes sp.]